MKIQKIQAPKKNNPVIPKNPSDPAHQQGNVGKAQRDLKKRYSVINKQMMTLVKQQKNYQSLATNAYYKYEISSARYDSINLFIQQLLNEQLLGNPQGVLSNQWFFQSYLSKAFNDGVRDSIQSAKNLSDPNIVGDDISQMIRNIDEDAFNPLMINRLGLIYSRAFNEMKGLTESSRVDLAETLTRGMSDGLGISEISRNIRGRVNVSFSRAQRIARTEILNAYRTGSREQNKDINENIYSDSDWKMDLLWWSALTSTTRTTHAAKHGLVYTSQEVEEFYSKDGNAINCYCNQSPALVNRKTGEIYQKDLQEDMKEQKKEWKAGMS